MESAVGNASQVQERLDELVDRAEIGDLICRYAHSVDLKDWDGFAALFTEDGALVLPWEGEGAGISGRDKLAKFADDALGRFPRTHHMMGNQQITVEGDAAQSTHYLHASHMRSDDPEDHWDVGGWYKAEYTRTPEGWRFSRVELDLVWQAGGADALDKDQW